MPAPDSAYRGQKIANTHLKYDVFVTPSIPVVTTDFAPGEHERPWPPISSTLIYGSRDAVVVDSFISLEQAQAQADWIASTGKNLTTIYATHGHGDHFFGASVLLERFPKAHCIRDSWKQTRIKNVTNGCQHWTRWSRSSHVLSSPATRI